MSLARYCLIRELLIVHRNVLQLSSDRVVDIIGIYLSKLAFVIVRVVTGKIRTANSPQLQILLLTLKQC